MTEPAQRRDRGPSWAGRAACAAACAGVLALPFGARAAVIGDCDGDGSVTISELVTGVAIAIGKLPLERCRAFDANSDGLVTIDELVRAVAAALAGPLPTPTPSATPSVTPTSTPSVTPTDTHTPTATHTPTPTGPTPTPTFTMQCTEAAQCADGDLCVGGICRAPTPSVTPTASATATPTSTPTRSNTATPTPTFTRTPSTTASATPSITATPTPSPSPTATPTATVTPTSTQTVTPIPTVTSSPTPFAQVLNFGTVGGQPCSSTTVQFPIAVGLDFTVSVLHIDFCVDPTAFQVSGITCSTFSDTVSIDHFALNASCNLGDPINPSGQVHVDAHGTGGDSGDVFQPNDEIDCSVPVFPATGGGDYAVHYRVAATTSKGNLVNSGDGTITVFVDPSGRFQGQCCTKDSQCASGFCRDGDGAQLSACCESDCATGVCNSQSFAGTCCAPGGLPNTCNAP